MSQRILVFVAAATLAASVASWVALASAAPAASPATTPTDAELKAQVAKLSAQLAALEKRVPAPELGQQMLELQIRHDRLWWAGQAKNWNLAYFMVGELGEALRGIEETNGDAAELQPQRLSEVMPSIMNPAVKGVQKALASKDPAKFAAAFDRLSAACSACHQVAGSGFLHIQRPSTPLLDNLRYEPPASTSH
ncbi:MAG TPA: hypothetical protein VFG73_06470 [Rhodanobacteraceae bacterium]|nr:hypothetical protein [Rhodanobacteraceae bacterium]